MPMAVDPEKVYCGRPCKHGHDGLRWKSNHRCVECGREAYRRYRAENREKERERCRRYHAENAEKLREQSRRYYAEHRDERREYSRRYYAENPEWVAEKNRHRVRIFGQVIRLSDEATRSFARHLRDQRKKEQAT